MFSTVSASGIVVFIWSYNDLLTSITVVTAFSSRCCVILSMVLNMFGTKLRKYDGGVIVTIVPLLILYISQRQGYQVLAGAVS